MDRLPSRLQSALRLDTSRRERRFSDADKSRTIQSNFLPVGRTADTTTEVDLPLETSAAMPLKQHECSAENCALARSLGTTELLEIILGFLETSDVLNLRRTCRKWNAVTRESPNLRQHFFVHAQWDRHPENFELLDLKLPGLTIQPGEEVELGRWIQVSITGRAAHLICPDAGRRRRPRARSIYEGLRGGLGPRPQQGDGVWPLLPTSQASSESHPKRDELFITQPPIVNMQAFIERPITAVSSSSNPVLQQVEAKACAKLYCEAGITLGFLAETAASLSSSNDSAGVVFKAIISFSPPTTDRRKRRVERNVTYIS